MSSTDYTDLAIGYDKARKTTTARVITSLVLSSIVSTLAPACGDGSNGPMGPTGPTGPETMFEITALLTVYDSADSGAFWSRGTTNDARIGQILLGTNSLTGVGPTTNLNNEAARDALQSAVARIRQQFGANDYLAAFNDTQANLERYLNDADGDGWAIDGRNGVNTDWPYDGNGNDPDGWTAQLVVNVKQIP